MQNVSNGDGFFALSMLKSLRGGNALFVQEQYEVLLRDMAALINYALFWCNVNAVRRDEMLSVYELWRNSFCSGWLWQEGERCAHVRDRVQRDRAVMCSENERRITLCVCVCVMQIWCGLTCSPMGPGSPGKPLGPSSPFWPNMPCCPLGPDSPSLPCRRSTFVKSKYLYSNAN